MLHGGSACCAPWVSESKDMDIFEALHTAEPSEPNAEGATAIDVALHCRACGVTLTLEEMHFLANPSGGSATCCACEETWARQMAEYREGARQFPPERP